MTVQEITAFLKEHQEGSSEATTSDGLGDFLRLARTADAVAGIVRASGGLVRSYKALKATAASVACCVEKTPLEETVWDGLFFGVWSSKLSRATDFACDSAMEPTNYVTRYYWTKNLDPLHTIYAAAPLSEAELKKLAKDNEPLLRHVLAMSLLPWNIPLQWLLLLEAFSVARGDTPTKEAFAKFVRPVWPEAQASQIAHTLEGVVKRAMHVELSDFAEEAVVSEVLPKALNPQLWKRIENYYKERASISLKDSGSGEYCGFMSLAAKSTCVKETYEYLMQDATDILEKLLRAKSFREAADIAQNRVLEGLPENEGSRRALEQLEQARQRQIEYYDLVDRKHRNTAAGALHTAQQVCAAVKKQRQFIAARLKDINEFIHELAEHTEQDGLPVRWEWYQDKEMTLVALPILRSVSGRVQERPPQQGLAVHIYHLLQPAEVTRAVLSEKDDLLLRGGVFADEL